MLLLEAPRALAGLRLFRRSVGAVKIDPRFIRFAVPGQCDLYGFWRGGRSIELEVKAAGGALSPNQRAWRDFCLEWGIPWIELRPYPPEDVRQTLDRWLRLISKTS